jgi:competence protein ComEA
VHKKIITFLACMHLALAFAGVDVNQASEADLDGIKGLGPATTRLILAERQKADFKSWADLISRVKGLGQNSAVKLSEAGLSVNGVSYMPKAGAQKAGAQNANSQK